MAAARSDAMDADSRGEDGEVYHRDNIFEFFRNHTAYDMLPESGKVGPHTRCCWHQCPRSAHVCCSEGDGS